MADSWEILISGSSLPIGDAWEHLNAQSGNSILVLTDGVEIEVNKYEFEIELDLSELEIEIQDGFELEVYQDEFEIEV